MDARYSQALSIATSGGTRVGYATLSATNNTAAAPSTTSAREPSAVLFKQLLLPLLIVLGLCLVALLLARRIERPIRSLTQAMQHLRNGDGTAHAEPSGPAELAQLARDFNRLLRERLDAEATLHAQHRALQEAKERADQAMQITQMGQWTWDLRTGTLYADDMLARQFGYEPTELRAVPITQWRARTEPSSA